MDEGLKAFGVEARKMLNGFKQEMSDFIHKRAVEYSERLKTGSNQYGTRRKRPTRSRSVHDLSH